jgi:hypothetical protein
MNSKETELPATEEKGLEGTVSPVEDDFDARGEMAQVHTRLRAQELAVGMNGDRIESMDRTLFNGLRGVVMLIDRLECAVNPLSEPEEKAAALVKVREVIDMMKGTLK